MPQSACASYGPLSAIDVHVDGRDPTVLGEPDLDAAVDAGRAPADVVLLLAVMRIITGAWPSSTAAPG